MLLRGSCSQMLAVPALSRDAEPACLPMLLLPPFPQGLDVGPDSNELIKKALSDCKTILWNGPMGGEWCDAVRCGTVWHGRGATAGGLLSMVHPRALPSPSSHHPLSCLPSMSCPFPARPQCLSSPSLLRAPTPSPPCWQTSPPTAVRPGSAVTLPVALLPPLQYYPAAL